MKPARLKKPRAAILVKTPLRPEGEPIASPNHQIASDDGKPALPKGWVWARLGEIRLDEGEGVLPSKTPEQKFELYSVPNFEQDKPEIKLGKEIGSNKQTVEEGAVLVCKINPRIDRIWIVGNHTAYPKIASTEWIPFFKQDGIDPKYLCYFMRTNNFRDYLASNVSGVGGSLMRVKASVIERYGFPLPPLPEQHRIVAKIEELFTKLDAGVEALKKAKAQLQRYRQSVLKDAFAGKLTKAWREAHKGELEPASVLLERIKDERKKNAKGKYKEPPPVDISNLPELPEGWVWARLDQLAAYEPNSITDGPFGSNLKTVHYTPRVIRLQNIGEGKFHDEKAHISEDHFRHLRRHEIFADVLVIAALGENSPRACIIPDFVGPAIVKADCIRFKPHRSMTDSKYLNSVLNSKQLKKFAAMIVHGVGRPRLNQQEIRPLSIPFAPLSEPHLIIEEIERRFSIVEEVEKVID